MASRKKSEKTEKKLRKDGDEKEEGENVKDHYRMRNARRKGAVDQVNLLMKQATDT